MNLVDLIAREAGKCYRQKTRGGEYCGPCPWCGGDDRFDIWVEDRPRYWCRVCDRKGDAIQFMRDYSSLSFAQARERAAQMGLAEPGIGNPNENPSGAAPKPAGDAPTGVWAERGADFLAECQAALWADIDTPIWDYLRSRMLKTATADWAGLGYHAADCYEDRERWGLPPKTDGQGRPARVWLPRGLVIPWHLEGNLCGLRIRRPTKPGDNLRYIAVPTPESVEPLYLADEISTDRPAMLLEGEIDALTVWQSAKDLVAGVATGSTQRAQRVRWISRLATVPAVLVAFDADKGGDDGATYWLNALNNAYRWRPFWADANDMARFGVDLRAWVEAGIAYAGLTVP